MAATYRSFMHVVNDPNKWEGSLRSEAVLARYATLLSHTDSLVFVIAHNVSGRLVVAKPELPPSQPTAVYSLANCANAHEDGSSGRNLKSGGCHGSGGSNVGWEAEALGQGGGDSGDGGSSDRCIELRVYTPLAKCHTHRIKLSIDQVSLFFMMRE